MSARAPQPVCDYTHSNYQQEFWGRGGRAYEDLAERIALRKLLPRGGLLCLEVGAGAGRLTDELQPFERVVLLDYSRTQLQQAQARLGRSARYIYVAADVYQLPFVARQFDCVTMVRVLHHMADAPAALAGVAALLRPAAPLLLEFASKLHVKAIARYALRMQAWSPFSSEPVEFAALNFDFHPRAVRAWLAAAGMRVEQCKTVSHLRAAFLKRALPHRLLATIDGWLQETGNLWQLTPSVIVRAVAAQPAATAAPVPAREPEMFCCPLCRSTALVRAATGLDCARCRRHWPLQDGIYNFKTQPELVQGVSE